MKEKYLPPAQQKELAPGIDNAVEAYKAIAARDDTDQIEVRPGVQTVLSLDKRYEGAATEKAGVGDQELMAFIRSGDRLYSVAAFQSKDSQEVSYSLSKVGLPGAADEVQRRAHLVGAITKNGLTFPEADSLDDPGIDISIDNNLGLLIGPSGDKKIQILSPKEPQEVERGVSPSGAEAAMGGLKRIIKGRRGRDQVPQLDLRDFEMWAPKTNEVAGAAQKAAVATASRPRIPSFSPPSPAQKKVERGPEGLSQDKEPKLTKELMEEVKRRLDEEHQAKIEAKKQEINGSIDELRAGLSENDATLMRKYSHYMFEKRKMWDIQDDNGAMNADGYASEALGGMSPDAKKMAYKYHELRQQLDSLR